MAKHPKICIVGLKCYDLLSGAETPRYIGGIENQLVLLARGLAGRGWAVSFVTYDHGQPDGIDHHGIHIYKAYERERGIPGVRFLHPRWTGLSAALARAEADIYYQMGAGSETGQVACWCRRRRRHFVFATASDADCLPGLPLLKDRREKWLYRYGLKAAQMVISQTQGQEQLLLAHYGIASRMFRILSPEPPASTVRAEDRKRILWVGRICPEKRPHLLPDIARRLPEYTFDVIGDANADTAYAREFRREVRRHPSIVLHGRVSNDRLRQMYDEAILLVGTSQTEGFPVTFIEAWSRAIPVVSTFDPDHVIRDYGLGAVAAEADTMASSLRRLLLTHDAWLACSQAARQYYLNHHAPQVCLPRIAQLLTDVAESSHTSGLARTVPS